MNIHYSGGTAHTQCVEAAFSDTCHTSVVCELCETAVLIDMFLEAVSLSRTVLQSRESRSLHWKGHFYGVLPGTKSREDTIDAITKAVWPFAKLLWPLVVEQALHRCRKCWRKNERKKRRSKRNKSVHHLSIMCSKFYNVTLMHSASVSVLPALQIHHATISCTHTHLTALFQGLPR